ncbi:unnamed protein product [Eruca vesicaria subsp. sativa]|uniref:Uncharacterized protein n=1 Tax=Eruca vesicaria subsp. sativa TaxID=29727 RepID=A0ABC8KWX4_ERUVS|nr:unnamed protein product [Eruca vesicaria subsp. sativa]
MEDLQVHSKKEVDKIRWEKLKRVASMAAPMVVVNISQTLLQATSTMIVGHKSEISLAGIALASSIANVTGFSLLSGLASALETLCGQAFGARQYEKLGSYTFTSIVSLLIICFPISLLWIFMKNILLLFHQKPDISEIASVYCLWLIPALFGYSVLQSLIRYFQTQSLIFPMVFSSLTVLCFHVPVCWVLVYTLGLGTKGAALSVSLSYWLNAVFLWFFMRRSHVCEGKRVFISMEAFGHMRTFFSLAVPSAMMICLEWSAFEILVLISGVLPNSKLETSVISMCVTSSSLHYNLATAIGAAARFITPKREEYILVMSNIFMCPTTTNFLYKNQRAKEKRRALTYHKSESVCTDYRPKDSRYHQHTTICARRLQVDHDKVIKYRTMETHRGGNES